MDLTGDAKFNPKHIPKPADGAAVSDQCSGEFHLPLGLRIVYESNFVKLLVRRLMPVLFCQLSQAPRERKAHPRSC
jgi:hypothetical protein